MKKELDHANDRVKSLECELKQTNKEWDEAHHENAKLKDELTRCKVKLTSASPDIPPSDKIRTLEDRLETMQNTHEEFIAVFAACNKPLKQLSALVDQHFLFTEEKSSASINFELTKSSTKKDLFAITQIENQNSPDPPRFTDDPCSKT